MGDIYKCFLSGVLRAFLKVVLVHYFASGNFYPGKNTKIRHDPVKIQKKKKFRWKWKNFWCPGQLLISNYQHDPLWILCDQVEFFLHNFDPAKIYQDMLTRWKLDVLPGHWLRVYFLAFASSNMSILMYQSKSTWCNFIKSIYGWSKIWDDLFI